MTLAVVRALGLCTIQDLGRRGHMQEAVPPGGALVPELLVAANRAARNPDAAPAIEVLGQLVVRAEVEVTVAVDHEPRVIAAGEELVVASTARRCAYLAVRGGFLAPRILDGYGTLLCAQLGSALRAGDVVERAAAAEVAAAAEPFVEATMIPVIPGPDLDAFAQDALAVLVSSAYRILPSSDRVGTRLAGPSLSHRPDHYDRPRPMVQGALEVPSDGQPIVLGPEHPTTGGYPILGVIASAELGRFHALPLGSTVTFSLSARR